MNLVPNPIANPMDLSFIFDIPSEELLKIAVIGMVTTGLFITWFGKKFDDFQKRYWKWVTK